VMCLVDTNRLTDRPISAVCRIPNVRSPMSPFSVCR
jgi:hypothetical protein